jgi:hypothetical protein
MLTNKLGGEKRIEKTRRTREERAREGRVHCVLFFCLHAKLHMRQARAGEDPNAKAFSAFLLF